MESEDMKRKRLVLCKKCAKTDETPFYLAGIAQRCAYCQGYAEGKYEWRDGKWKAYAEYRG